MVDGVNETTSSQNSIYNLSLSDLSTLDLDDKTEKAIRKYFAKHDITNKDTLDLSTYDKDNNGIIDDDERKEAGLKKSVVKAFNKVLRLKKEQIPNKTLVSSHSKDKKPESHIKSLNNKLRILFNEDSDCSKKLKKAKAKEMKNFENAKQEREKALKEKKTEIGAVSEKLTKNSKLTATKFEDGATKYEDQDGRRAGYVNADGNLVVINNPDEHTMVIYIDTDCDGIVDDVRIEE